MSTWRRKWQHSSILAWKTPWTEELEATVHGVTQSQTRLKRLSFITENHKKLISIISILYILPEKRYMYP